MATPLTDSINALTAYANEVTGGSDTNLSDAVHTLASGYGGNSQFKTDGGTLYLDADTTSITVTHSLGSAPDFAYIYADLESADLLPYGACYMVVTGKMKISGMPNTSTDSMPFYYSFKHGTSGNFLGGQYSDGRAKTDPTSFSFNRGGGGWKKLDANGNPIPYKWMVGRFA